MGSGTEDKQTITWIFLINHVEEARIWGAVNTVLPTILLK